MSLLEKLIIAGVLALVLLGAAWKAVDDIEQHGYDRRMVEEDVEAKRVGALRDAATATVDTKHAQAAERIKVVTIKQIEEVPTYVSANDCPMSPGFRVLHDAAAAGELPDPAGIADAAAVPAPALAGTIVANYGTCTENAERLSALQAWVSAQKGVR